MEAREAQNLVRSIEQHWRTDFGEDGRRIWREAMVRYDSVVASIAVQRLAETQRERPTILDVRQVIAKLEADDRAKTPGLPEPKPEPVPDWVFVWRWARWHRDPKEERDFPQMHPEHRPTSALTDEEYTRLHGEWVKAGCPGRKLKAKDVLPSVVTRS